MNIDRAGSTGSPSEAAAFAQRMGRPIPAPTQQQVADMCRDLDARGVKYVMVGGVPVVPQGFSAPAKQASLFEQCLEMNRQAAVRPTQK